MTAKTIILIQALIFSITSIKAFAQEPDRYEGPMIDGHAHIAKDYKYDLVRRQNEMLNISKMVVLPRLFQAENSDGTTEEEASRFAEEFKDTAWVTVALQRRDLYDMDWNDPAAWFHEWLNWAREEIMSGRRRGLGELTARHYAYTKSDFAERDYPIDSKMVDALMKLSSDTQRPLVLHAEGESHVVKAIKVQLKKHPKAILVWAHACGRSSPALVKDMLGANANLFCDLSNMTDTGNYGSGWPRSGGWTYQWEVDGKIIPAWVEVMEQYPDRFYLGMDSNQFKSWINKGRQSRFSRINRFRELLPQLSKETIEQVTVKVATKLYGDR